MRKGHYIDARAARRVMKSKAVGVRQTGHYSVLTNLDLGRRGDGVTGSREPADRPTGGRTDEE
jgi:hypothetical protein